MYIEDKTIKALEWSVITKTLAGYTTNSLGRELAYTLMPFDDEEDVVELLKQTTEAKSMLQQAMSPPLGGIFDIREALQKATIGQTLDDRDFVDIASTLVTSSKLYHFFTKLEEDYPYTSRIATLLIDHSSLVDSIYRCYDTSGNLLDGASATLKQLKTSLRDNTNNLKDKLNSLLHNKKVAKCLQEPVFTMRNNRYVLPVKAEHKVDVPGIVHDVSSSGVTIFIEPRDIVDLNNKIKEIELRIEQEIERIKADLTRKVAQYVETIKINLELLATIDLIFAKGRYSIGIDAGEPEITEDKIIDLRRARHPILVKTIETVIPNDIRIDSKSNTIIVTGSNTGGKTVLLKTIGLCVMMAAAGLHIPVDTDSKLYLFKSIFADIGDEQSIEQSLSTFSSHMTNIINVVNRINDESLVLLDELGAGTDPQEGTALAQAILEYFTERNAFTIITTHYGGLKSLAYSHEGFMNASVEFNPETLKPTYKLLLGVPGKSNATTIAQNLGLKDDIINRAEELYTSTVDEASLMLNDLQRIQHEISKELEQAKKEKQQSAELRKEFEDKLTSLNKKRTEKLKGFRSELNKELSRARNEVLGVLDTLKNERTEKTAKQAYAKLANLESESANRLDKYQNRFEKAQQTEKIDWSKVKEGTLLYLPKLNKDVEVISISGNRVTVQVGLIKTTVKKAELVPSAKRKKDEYSPSFKETSSPTKSLSRRDIGMEIDLRGKTVEDGLKDLDIYLDKALITNMPAVSIIHGHGTGQLRKAVRNYLKNAPYVVDFRPGEQVEGGDGVTIVSL